MRGREEFVAVISKDRETQFEALRIALGAVLEDHKVDLYILRNKLDFDYMRTIGNECVDEFKYNLEGLLEMGGSLYSDVKENEKFGFKILSLDEIIEKLKEYDVIIPY